VNQSTIGRRYASALFQLLDVSGIEPARNALGVLAHGLEDTPDLRHVLASPIFTLEEKQVVLKELCLHVQAPSIIGDFLTQLLKNNRAVLLPEIYLAFSSLADEQKGIQQIHVISAKSLDATEQVQVTHELTSSLGHAVDVAFEVRPELISGLKIHIGSQVIDNTVLGRLTSMQDQLTKG